MCKWKKIRMNGRRRKGGGREICMFFLYFCFWFQIQERKSVAGRCQPSYFIPSQRHRDTCRNVDKKNVMQRQREKIGHSIGQWIKD